MAGSGEQLVAAFEADYRSPDLDHRHHDGEDDVEFAYSANKIHITPGGTDPSLLAATTAAIPSLWPSSFKTFPVGLRTLWGGFGAYGNGQNMWMIAPWDNALDIYS